MEERHIKEIKEKVLSLLDKELLKKSIDTLGEEIEGLQDWSLLTRFNQMQTSYNYLLEYLRNGTPDPEREAMHKKFMGECYILNDLIAITRETEHSTTVYCQNRRKYKNLENIALLQTKLRENRANIDVTTLLPNEDCNKVSKELAQEREELLNTIFASIWCSTAWEKAAIEAIENLIDDEEIYANDRALVVSAITLSILKCFEPAKVSTLIKTATNPDITISTRAIVGLIISLFTYKERITFYPEILTALEGLCDNSNILLRIEKVQIQLLRCRETQKIDKKMREEIIPAMMKNPHLNSEKMGIDILKEIEQDDDKNPEWKEWIEKDEIKNKLEEMTQWQIEGADVYMSTFSQLKSYPFFNELKNWFRPFDIQTPAIAEILPKDSGKKKTLLSAICASRFFCNSDKYSFCLTFKQVPEEQRNMLMQQITGEEDIAAQEPETTSVAPAEKEAEIQSNQYIQDLYRFFKLSYFKKEFNDPFTLSLNLLESKELSKLIDSPEALLHIFSFLLNKGYYREAIETGKLYETRTQANELFYQEMGYCLQKEKEYNAAIDYYTRADIIKPDTLWTLRHIAQCYRLNNEPEKALSYYQLAEEIAPEDLQLLRQTGECFASLKRYDEAFARFFKAEYLNPGILNSMRAIAWCSFLAGKDEQARNYYNKILEQPKAKFTDYLNAAHTEWVMHNNSKAVELYKRAKELCDNNTLFDASLEKDFQSLRERGMKNFEFLLLRDLIG